MAQGVDIHPLEPGQLGYLRNAYRLAGTFGGRVSWHRLGPGHSPSQPWSSKVVAMLVSGAAADVNFDHPQEHRTL